MIQGKHYSAYGENKSEAVRRLEEKVNGCQPLDALTLRSWMVTAYLPTIQGMTPKTKEKAMWAIKHLGKLGDVPLVDLNRHNLQTLVNEKSRKLSPATVATMTGVWSAALNLAEADQHIPNNPMRHVKLPPQRHKPKATLSGPELLRLIEASRGHSGLPLVVLGGLLGLRIGEVQSIRAKHFTEGKLAVPGTKTAASLRELPLHPLIHAELEGLPIPLISPSQSACRNALLRNAKRAGIQRRINPHLLRHTFATLLEWLGCPFEIRSRLMGHSVRHVTQRYSHAEWKAWEEWTGKLATFVYYGLGLEVGNADGNGGENAQNA